MISEYGLAATLLIIYEDGNWENIIYLQARQVRVKEPHYSVLTSWRSTRKRQGELCGLLICSSIPLPWYLID